MLKLNGRSLDWSLKHINKFNDSYVFPRPFEFEAITEFWDDVKKNLLEFDVYSKGIRQYRTTITPKSSVGFRICTQLDPLDSIMYNAIIYEIHKEIESARVPANLDIVFSFRLNPTSDGGLYDPNYNWNTYNEKAKEILELEDEYSYVVMTDITDFYPSIYLHNIETYLRESVKDSGKSTHAETLIDMIKAMHLNQTHKGLPIGPQFSRPIAELILHEIDQLLIDNDIRFIRYVDDYRLFCKTETESYRSLAFLAQNLYDVLNLKLNEQKTKIMTKEKFKESQLYMFIERENDRVVKELYELFDKLGISRDYEDIDDYELDEIELARVRELNILELLEEELKKDEIDLRFVKFLIGNLARFDNTEVAKIILKEENMRKIFPILGKIINHLEKVRSFNEIQKHGIGEMVIGLLSNSFMSELEYNRSWLLYLFSKSDEWNNQSFFSVLLKKYEDSFTKRKLILNLGRANNKSYFRTNKLTFISDPWVKRAFLAAISCLPKNERDPYYKSQNSIEHDFLNEIVEKWAIKHPF
ncbi:reverse transcriptase domain-containing protein [Paenibacillus monticola]|uniref:Reverse transcriptase n=1 Tax=Paenibacillus monticola TaxID=2666075 RepID=A0A7X2HBB6_9BACL|nr:reverse transcriptase domain-containing protein [Paenibacillus monticola]MRN56855.1 reverse transcriptase [Paenibacillus monticola]